MRLLRLQDDGGFSLVEMFGKDIPQYAILSHTWGASNEEVTFRDLTEGTGKRKAGYRKLTFCRKQTAKDNLQYFWVDTCCIDKSSSAELAEAINSMFRWYKEAAKCYVYLSDITTAERTWEPAFRNCRWFTRGWTIQELLAPTSVEFFSREGRHLGDKTSLEQQIHEITGIAIPALRGAPLSDFSINERLLWAKSRQTTREEDKAYSLLGIFSVCMPLLYGEGEERAFKRLEESQEFASERMDQKIAAISQVANRNLNVDSALSLMAEQIAVLSAKANDVETLKITIEIMKSKIQRLEQAAAAPAPSFSYARASPCDYSAHSAQPSHITPSFHAMIGVPHVNTSQAPQRVVLTQSQPRQATDSVGTKRTHPNGIDSTQVSIGQPVGASKRPKLAPVKPSATYGSSQARSTANIAKSITRRW
jgi:hypothetical protein